MRAIWLIAKSVPIEAIRRREIYVIVLAAVGLILGTAGFRFLGFQGMSKFYREICLQIMNLATAFAVIILAARQLPREFENRTIYPLLAKPVSRLSFLAGKFAGVMLAGLFCYSIFIALFLGGMVFLGIETSWGLFLQAIYLQVLALMILGALSLMLSLLLNIDAAITVSILIYALGGTVSSTIDYVYDSVRHAGGFTLPGGTQSSVGEILMRVLNYGVPQMTLLDLSAKVVHANDITEKGGQVVEVIRWTPVAGWVLVQLTLYAAFYIALYFALAHRMFSRRAL